MKAAKRKIDKSQHVLIVGAGPVGLSLAAFLHLNNVSFTIVDEKPGAVADSRALGVHARTLEILQALGLSREFVRRGRTTRYMTFHLGDRALFSFDFGILRNETSFPFYLILPQYQTEAMLLQWLHEHGHQVEWNKALADINEIAEDVVATFIDGEKRKFSYVAGCDGASSLVRNKLNIGYTGMTYEVRFVLAEVRIAENRLRTDSTHVILAPDATVAAIPLPNGAYRLVGPDVQSAGQTGAASTMSFESFTSFLARNHLLQDVSLHDPERLVSYRMQKRVADSFRKGRIFLAGDAAHIHSPAGGQGMNSGIQDAANLAWKLGLVVRGEAPAALLDSYEKERRTIALHTAEATDRAMRITSVKGRFRRLILKLASPLFFALYQPKRLIRSIAQITVAYGDNTDNPSPGARMPWLPLANGEDIFDHIAPSGLTLLETGNRAQLEPSTTPIKRILLSDNQYFRREAKANEIETLPVRLPELKRIDNAARMLIRPDGYLIAVDIHHTGTNCTRAIERMNLKGMLA